jgi:NAD(P)-dependent dehydrogenase (short-subunit alcohol dehydrogenase family)
LWLTGHQGSYFTKVIRSDTYPFIQHSNHQGHSVFITGGNRGTGKAIALSYAKAGASAIGLGAPDGFGSLKAELEHAALEAGQPSTPSILLLDLDVTDSASVAKAASEVQKAFGKLDILVNNADYMTPALPVTSADESTWWRTFEVNLKGVFLMSQAFVPLLMQTINGLKTMVNINSVASHNLRINASAYGTSKWAVLKFTEFLLVEHAHQGLLAYSVHPGGIMSKLAEAMPKETHSGRPQIPCGMFLMKRLTSTIALTDTPELTGDTIAYLTQLPRKFLTGRYVSCTWDMEELMQRKDEIVDTEKLKVRLII